MMSTDCGRPTNNKRPCRNQPLHGMTACGVHATREDYAYREGWFAGMRRGREVEAELSASVIARLTARQADPEPV